MNAQLPYFRRADTSVTTLTLRILCAMALIFIFSARAEVSFAQQGYVVHIVRPGENLSTIAARYQISVSSLIQANNIRNPNHLKIGQRLTIPLDTPSEPLPTAQLAPISTLTPLGKGKPGNPASATSASPPLTWPTSMERVAPPTATPPIGNVHTVRPSESLSMIAAKYGTSIDALKTRNGLPSYTIYSGQRLIIPAGSRPANPYARPTIEEAAFPEAGSTTTIPTSTRTTATPFLTRRVPGTTLLPTAAATPTPSRK